jgi:DNA polymerase epsilon subunit 1
MIHKLMKKMFLQLIGEFRRLGSTIIYADFSKIVVCTKKKSMSDASAYIKFILSSIKSRELFHSLTMEPSRCWEYLWWMDQANYGGMNANLPKSLKSVPEEEEMGEGEEDGDGGREGVKGEEGSEIMEFGYGDQQLEEMQMNWNIRQYLPQAGSCQDFFHVSLIPMFHSRYKFIYMHCSV